MTIKELFQKRVSRYRVSPLLIAGLAIFVFNILFEILIVPLPDWLALPLLVLSGLLIMIGGWISRKRRPDQLGKNG